MWKNRFLVILLAILHLLCDLICGYKIVGILGNLYLDKLAFIYFIYNGLAFLFQPLCGIILDKIKINNKERICLGSTVLFLFIGLFLDDWLISCIMLGIGNMIFHVSGSLICSNTNKKDSSVLGVFVSLGAFGLSIGTNLYMYSLIKYFSATLYFIICLIVLLIKEDKIENRCEIIDEKKSIIVCSILIMIAVFIRSLLGKVVHFEFEYTLLIALLFGLCSSIGKFIGGFIRDKFGSSFTIIFSMVLSTVCLIFGAKSIVLILIGIICINISMPITLYELNRINPNHEGFNFGLLAAVLFIGVTIGALYYFNIVSYILIVIVSCVLSIVSIIIVVRRFKHGY